MFVPSDLIFTGRADTDGRRDGRAALNAASGRTTKPIDRLDEML